MAKVLCCILAVLLFAVISISFGQAHQQASGNADAKSSESIVACTDNSKKASELPPPGPQCAKEEFAKRGQPFMFPAHRGVAYGISSGPDRPSTLYLWADNRTEKEVDLLICCVSTLFDQIDIYDSAGVRLLSKADQAARKAGLEGRVVVGGGCTCSGWVLVPPHTIEFLEFADISDGYVLSTGRYVITERPPLSGLNPRAEGQTAASAPSGLAISIP